MQIKMSVYFDLHNNHLKKDLTKAKHCNIKQNVSTKTMEINCLNK